MKQGLILVILLITLIGPAFSQSSLDSFILPDIGLFGGRSTLEDRITFSARLGVDYFPGDLFLLSAGTAFDYDAITMGVSYNAGIGFVFAGDDGIEDVFGAFFDVSDGYSTTSTISGSASYVRLHILEVGIMGRQIWYENVYYDAGIPARVYEIETSHEIFASIGYRFLSTHDTLLPVFQDVSFAVRGLAGFYIIDKEVKYYSTTQSTTPGTMEFTYGGLVELKYYIFSAELGYINNGFYWSAYIRIPFSIFLD